MLFYKYHGTGNDFIMIDGRDNKKITSEQVKFLCDRHFGIGSDGILIIRKSDKYDFRMQFYNPDGTEATFCGNGARCIVKFANQLGIIKNQCYFEAKDGVHKAEILNKNVRLKMSDVSDFKIIDKLVYLNTGTQHIVKFVEDIEKIKVQYEGPKFRYDKRFAPEGTNVNFVQINNKELFVRTYEKGVEAETLSCGTGIVASALAFALTNAINKDKIILKTHGGKLTVEFEKLENKFKNIYLTAEAIKVFEGQINL